ncbi:MAG: deoxyribodipyrimidine photolyase [Acidobacteriota bacterium]|jgi:deoxyribodipyrimidine photo-lyase
MSAVPEVRIRRGNDRIPADKGAYVLYWMTAYRRLRYNHALQRAAEWARQLDRPLLILEPIRCGHRWASARFHRFVIQGMAGKARSLARSPALYYPYVEPEAGAGKGLLAALARRACLIVGDDFPCFFLPRMVEAACRLPAAVEMVDANGLMPLAASDHAFPTAFAYRRFVQRELRHHLDGFPVRAPLARAGLRPMEDLPGSVLRRWPMAAEGLLRGDEAALSALPVDPAVGPVELAGGEGPAGRRLAAFVEGPLDDYGERRNLLDEGAASGLSPYLHFGHIAPHEVFLSVTATEDWDASRLSLDRGGSRQGWWGMRPAAEAFLDQLVTWRELGHNMCHHREDYDRFESLPDWARRTLAEHAGDPRPHRYSLEELDGARTHSPLWNAAQGQLVRDGVLHNYMRMVWGKKILEWTASPREALRILVELNNRYALDGRDPNSYSGIFWVLGRYDRAWGPERPVFGKVRYMSLENTARKLRTKAYVARYAAPPSGSLF